MGGTQNATTEKSITRFHLQPSSHDTTTREAIRSYQEDKEWELSKHINEQGIASRPCSKRYGTSLPRRRVDASPIPTRRGMPWHIIQGDRGLVPGGKTFA
jgi:hypothetical protein